MAGGVSWRRVVWLQCGIGLGLSLLLLPQGWAASLSVLAGAAVALAGALLYAAMLRGIRGAAPSAILYLHFAAELAKLIGMLAALLAVLFFFRQADWMYVVGGCLAAYSAYWFVLLIKD